MPESISGKSVAGKHREVLGKLGISGSIAYIVSACDEIMWLCNLRGDDIEYNPVALSYCVLTQDTVHLFCHTDSLTAQARDYLLSQRVELHEYDSFRAFLSNLGSGVVRVCQSSSINVNNWNAAFSSVDAADMEDLFREDPTPGGSIAWLRSRKNSVELDGFR